MVRYGCHPSVLSHGVHTSYWLEYRLWRLKPAGYHVVNILLHGTGAVLLLVGLPSAAAWLSAAVLALHVESVAWITEHKNVLSGVFYLGSALAYLHYALSPRGGSSADQFKLWYAASLVLFPLALLSKSVACSLPAAPLLVLWWKRGRVGWSDLVSLTPYFILGLAFALLTVWMEKHRVGAVGLAWDLSWVQRCLIAGPALWFYAGNLCWPGGLAFIYHRWQIDPGVWWQYLFSVAAESRSESVVTNP